MYEFLLYMALPTLLPLLALSLHASRLGLWGRMCRMLPLVAAAPLVCYPAAEIGTCILKPWFFDCSKTLGICPCGLPVAENFLLSFLMFFGISLAVLVFQELELRSSSWPDFALKLAFFREPRLRLA